MLRTYIAVLAGVGLTACAPVGPEYVSPSMDLSNRFADGAGASRGQRSDEQWWMDYRDPILNDLINRGFSQNLSIKSAQAAAQAAEARAQAAGLSALQQPSTAAASTDRTEIDGGPTNRTNSATLNVTYVFDVFGRVQRNHEAADAARAASRFRVGTARLAYLSAIVGSYIDARYALELLELNRQAIASQRQLLRIVRDRRAEGEASELQVAQAQASLDTQIAQLPLLESTFRASVFSIATLLDEPALPLLVKLERGAPQPMPHGSHAIGVPADLLLNRPDIKSAERNFAAAVARVGVAEAELYPSIALSGTIGINSDASTVGLGPTLSVPLLNRKALEANRQAAAAQAEQAQIEWRASVTQAIGEAQSAQSAFHSAQREAASLRSALRSNRRALELTNSAYLEGEASLLDLIAATEDVTETRQSLALAIQRTASSWLNLQIASGAGWAVN